MRSSRSAHRDVALDTGLRPMLVRNLAGLAGVSLIIAAGLIGLALATWSVSDPSLSHATRDPARNALGFSGAIIADLMMQLFGLAATIGLLPAVVIGWRLSASGRAGFARAKAATWIALLLVASLACATLPVIKGWPLPLGLGGVVGDLLLKPITAVTGADIGRLLGGLVAGFGALLLLIATLTPARPGRVTRAAKAAPVRRKARAVEEESFDDEEPSGGFMPMAVLHHWTLVARANLMRLVGRRPRLNRDDRAGRGRANDDDDFDNLDDFDDEPPVRPVAVRGRAARQEPVVALRMPTPRAPAMIEPRFEDDDADDRDAGLHADPHSGRYADEDDDAPFDLDDEPPMVAAPQRVAQPAQRTPAPQAAAHEPNTRLLDRKTAIAPGPRAIGQVKRNAPATSLPLGAFPDEGYQFPALHFLAEPKRVASDVAHDPATLEANARDLEGVLEDFGVKGEIIHVRPGPVVTLYELEPAPGVKSSRVIGLADDIARSMSAVSARVAVVPGRNVIGIELPNQRRETVYFRELVAATDFQESKHKLALCLGKTIGGEPVIADLARMPHLLVAGTTGSGKSVAINTMILSLLYRLTPEQCKLIMIDPKMLELSVYDGIPHLLSPVVTDPKKAVVALKWTVREMEDRYRKMSKLGVRNIDGFNARVAEAAKTGEILTREVQTGFDRSSGEPIYEVEELALVPLPYIVVIVDEMADLMMVAGKDIEGAIQRLAQMARAAGIHIVMATQRPSVDVITGTIKANFPTRISFQVTSKIDSRTILGEQGAEQLLGQGDMLYMAGGGRIQRVHGPFVADNEVEKVVQHLKRQGAPEYLEAITAGGEDEDGGGDAGGGMEGIDALEESNDLYDKAVAVVLRDKKVSTSYIQRRLQIGYNRAASLIERMEREGLVSSANHAGKREILVGDGVD